MGAFLEGRDHRTEVEAIDIDGGGFISNHGCKRKGANETRRNTLKQEGEKSAKDIDRWLDT